MKKPSLYLKVNNNDARPGRAGAEDSLEYQGILEFKMDGRCKAENFVLEYGNGFKPIELTFDASELSQYQRQVSRFLGGFLKKEWQEREKKGKKEAKYFDKSRMRAICINAPQQENLNDCGVFVLENVLRILDADSGYPRQSSTAEIDNAAAQGDSVDQSASSSMSEDEVNDGRKARSSESVEGSGGYRSSRSETEKKRVSSSRRDSRGREGNREGKHSSGNPGRKRRRDSRGRGRDNRSKKSGSRGREDSRSPSDSRSRRREKKRRKSESKGRDDSRRKEKAGSRSRKRRSRSRRRSRDRSDRDRSDRDRSERKKRDEKEKSSSPKKDTAIAQKSDDSKKSYIDQIWEDPLNTEKLSWAGQDDVRHRRKRLMQCVQFLFEQKKNLGTGDLEKMMEQLPDIKSKLREFLVDKCPPEERRAALPSSSSAAGVSVPGSSTIDLDEAATPKGPTASEIAAAKIRASHLTAASSANPTASSSSNPLLNMMPVVGTMMPATMMPATMMPGTMMPATMMPGMMPPMMGGNPSMLPNVPNPAAPLGAFAAAGSNPLQQNLPSINPLQQNLPGQAGNPNVAMQAMMQNMMTQQQNQFQR